MERYQSEEWGIIWADLKKKVILPPLNWNQKFCKLLFSLKKVSLTKVFELGPAIFLPSDGIQLTF